MIVTLGVLYRRSKESVESAATPLFSSPYFERVAPTLMTRLLFFLRPMFPLYIIILPADQSHRVLYDVTYPWERIAELKEGTFFTFFSNRPIKLNQTLKNTVEIRLRERRATVDIGRGPGPVPENGSGPDGRKVGYARLRGHNALYLPAYRAPATTA